MPMCQQCQVSFGAQLGFALRHASTKTGPAYRGGLSAADGAKPAKPTMRVSVNSFIMRSSRKKVMRFRRRPRDVVGEPPYEEAEDAT